jgi:hypothetical protein
MRLGRAWVVLGLLLAALARCAGAPAVTPVRVDHRAATGAPVADGAGALIDKGNRWRGAARGAALGDVLTGSVTDISSRAARESVTARLPVTYQSTDGWQRVEAAPGATGAPGCPQVHERIYQDNQLVREQIREVC